MKITSLTATICLMTLISSCGIFNRNYYKKTVYADSIAAVTAYENQQKYFQSGEPDLIQNDSSASADSIAVSIIGNDRDVHGCIRSAGFTWSQVQGRCMQLFNEGIKLLPVENNTTNKAEPEFGVILHSFIVFSSDSMRAELFLPNKEPLLFHKTASNNASGTWISGNYKIESQNNIFIVLENMDIILKQY